MKESHFEYVVTGRRFEPGNFWLWSEGNKQLDRGDWFLLYCRHSVGPV